MTETTGKGWQAFLRECPERIVEVIENGPFPLKEYGGSKLTYADKKKGMMRFKGGGDGRNHVNMKRGMQAIVYFDPAFCEGEWQLIDVPQEVQERHAKANVLEEFKKL